MSSVPFSPIIVSRDCDATLIPGGSKMLIHAGEEVVVTQSLGGTFTVSTASGYLARIAGEDADALGMEVPPPPPPHQVVEGPFEMERVMDELRQVFDPEIPVNVVDLGLIYSCEAHELPDGATRVDIEMSMTAPGCGMGDILADDAKAKILELPGVGEVEIELVWDPPWDISRMSEAAKLQLGMY
jgi:probable FeS assembly SUF system protein SufT